MSIIRLVRHGEAAAAYSQHPDPGLSERGLTQAESLADRLQDLGPLAVISSPMARAQETAAPLAQRWGTGVVIEQSVSEIPSPGLSPNQRGPWLSTVMAGTWDEAGADIRRWRDEIAEALVAMADDAVVFSHFVAINAAIAVAIDADTPRTRHLDHCSVTTFDTTDGTLRLIDAGDEAATVVL